MNVFPTHTDVFVVGGGPTGLATAIALRARGFAVMVADAAQSPIDKACGEGLMPDAIASLQRLGVTLSGHHTFPFRGIRFLGCGASVDASFPNGVGAGMRRTYLHQELIDRAEEAGVTLLWGSPVKGLSDTGVLLGRGTVKCRWVVGADGENSRVRNWAGLERARSRPLRFGFRRHYRIAPWTDCVEVYWGSEDVPAAIDVARHNGGLVGDFKLAACLCAAGRPSRRLRQSHGRDSSGSFGVSRCPSFAGRGCFPSAR